MLLLFRGEPSLKHGTEVVGNLMTSDHSTADRLVCFKCLSPRIPRRLLGMSPDMSGSQRSPVGAGEGVCDCRSWGTPQLQKQTRWHPARVVLSAPTHHAHHTWSILKTHGSECQWVEDVTREPGLSLHLCKGQFSALT